MKKIFSLFVALTAMVAVNAADYYLVGGFCGWNTGNAVKFTEVSAGNYEVIIEDLSGEGKVLGTTTGWLPQYGVIGGNNVITIGGPACVLTLKAQDSDDEPGNIKFGKDGFGYKNAKLVLTVAGDQVSIAFVSGEEYDLSAKPDTYQIVGAFTNNWNTADAIQFEEVAGVLTANVPDLSGTFKIIKNRAWDEQWGTNRETNAGLAVGVPYVMSGKLDGADPGNLAFANPFAGYKNAKFTLEVKEDGAMVLTLVSGDFYAVESDWHLPGTKLGWNCEVDQRFEKIDDNTYELLAAEFGADFKVVYGNWAVEFGAPSEDAKWEINKEYTCAFKGGNIHAIDDAAVFTDCTIRLVVDYENAVVKITISSETTGVEDVVAPTQITKVIENGQMYIIRDGVRYNALGAVVK